MNRKIPRIVTFCMVGMISFAGRSVLAEAAEIPIAGIDVVLSDFFQNNSTKNETIMDYLTPSEYENIAIAQVTNYVNIRSKANEQSEILGKLYNNSAASILETENEWCKIESGSVTGYIKSEYLVIGDEVEELAKEVGQRLATVNTTTLKVREKASLEAPVQTLVPIGAELNVKKELEGWVKVSMESDVIGYVSADYVDLSTEFDEAESIEEENARLAAEEAAWQAAEEENRRESVSNQMSSQIKSTYSNSSTNSSSSSTNSPNTSSVRSNIVAYSLQFVGNPYVWGGTSLTNGTDCSGFTQSIFRNYGISIPRTSRSQAASGRVISYGSIQLGDLVFYGRSGTINHVAIYIGNGKVISASSPETGIRVTNYNYREPYKIVSYIN